MPPYRPDRRRRACRSAPAPQAGDDHALVLPAHYGDSVDVRAGSVVAATLGALRGALWQLGADEDEFVGWAARAASPRPPNYEAIVRANQRGVALDEGDRRALEEGPNRCAVAS